MLIASEVAFLLDSFCRQSWKTCMYINVHICTCALNMAICTHIQVLGIMNLHGFLHSHARGILS